ncbi:MAG: hypothetical protein JW787_16470 [Sedimentisphaerales bacterium]|nr:hypothetical protein [Sedimentisphaerales bacterium]
MRPSENIEKIVRDGKPNVKTSDQLDKLIIEGSYSIMDEYSSLSRKFNMFTLLIRNKIAISTIAAVIFLAIGLLIFRPENENNIDPPEVTNVTQTPAEMMSLMSINLAYNRGGLDEVEKQYEKAMQEIRPRPTQVTIAELLTESNGT